jgi:hypothetical protein
VWPNPWRVFDLGQKVIHDLPDLALPHASPAPPQEQRRTRPRRGQNWPASADPAIERIARRHSERYDSLLPSLTGHAEEPVLRVEVVDVEPTELTHAHARRVEHLDHRGVAQPESLDGGIVVRRLLGVFVLGDRLPIDA